MVCILLLNKTNENMLIVRQCWVLFFYYGLFAGVYSIRYEEDSKPTVATTVESRQLQSGFFPSEFNQNGNNGNSDYSIYNNYDDNSNQYQNGNTLQFPSNQNQDSSSQFQNIQDNSIFNSGEYYAGNQPQYQNNFNEVRPVEVPNRENTDAQYLAYQNQGQPIYQNSKPPITTYFQQDNPFQPNLQNPPPNRPFPSTQQRPIGPFQRPQRPPGPVNNIPRPLGPVNNIPRPPSGQYQQNYAGNFNNYQTTSNPISNFISNIGQGAADFLGGGQNSNYFIGPNGGPPQQFDSFNRPVGPNINGPNRPRPSGGPPLGPFNSPIGTIEQLGKAIDEITRNDDFQCIPKVICQMFGNQRQQSSYSSILASPIFSGLIAAVPSSSTGLVYGRAALLGYTSGEFTCNGAYPKCPKNENDLLYYLNNHRGGFFRFFNGGATFGDDSNYNYNQNNHQAIYQNTQHNQNYNQQQHSPQQSTVSNLAALQNLAEVINQSDGINLSNLASNGGLLTNLAGLVGGNSDLLSGLISGAGTAGGGGASGGASSILNSLISGGNGNVQSADPISLLTGLGQNNGAASNIGSVVGNLLTGFIGNRFSSRKLSKRSIQDDTDVNVSSSNEESSIQEDEDNSSEKQVDLNTGKTIVFDVTNSSYELSDIEPRIVHGKVPISSEAHDSSQNVKFIDESEGKFPREEKQIKFEEHSENKKSLFFSSPNPIQTHNIIFPTSDDTQRLSKKIKFGQSNENFKIPSDSAHFFPIDSNHVSSNEINDAPQRIKMVFPDTDRTGTGNLIFDNHRFDTTSVRIGKILTGLRVLQQLQAQQSNTNSNQILFDTSNSNRYAANSNYNTNPLYALAQSNDRYQPSFANRYTTNQQANNHRFGNQNYNINYNSQSTYNGKLSGSTGDSSQNVYVANDKGVVEYYINSAGVKVYV